MAGVLEGVRVVDFGQYVAGPFAAMLLADQGADVVRVEMPGGPKLRSPANAIWNRGKRSIVLDLTQDADRDVARRLVATADVVIENFRPGVMQRLGLGAEEMTFANARLIYCSMPGFASDDPRSDVQAWEGVVEAAAAGYARRTDRINASEQRRPVVFSALPFSSSYAAFLSVISIAMALNARDRDGAGQRIEVPLFDATFAVLGYRLQRIHADGSAPADAPRPRGAGTFGLAGPHRCADGRWIYFHSGNKNVPDFLAAVGASAWTDEPDARERMGALFASRPAHEWEDLGHDIGTEVVMFRSSAEWLNEEHARASRMIVELRATEHGTMLQPGIQARLSLTPGAIRGPASAAGADREAVLQDLNARTERATGGTPQAPLRAVLEGVKVLDLCIVLAGPTCGRTLAEFGADVIKIDGPPRRRGPAAMPLAGPGALTAFNLDVNRGKRSIVLDLKTAEGLEVFWKLTEDADVIVENFRDGVADRLGIGYAAVRTRRPGIVYASLNTYGYEGPWSGRPGHEQLAQSGTGMALRFGGLGNTPMLQNIGAVNDYGTGLMGAYAVALALLHRARTGEGQRVDTALAYTACALQALYMHDFDGKVWDEPQGQDALGWSPLQRLYETADGWIFVGAASGESLAAVEGAEAAEGVAALEEAFRTATSEAWVKRLRAAGVGAHAVVSVSELLDDPWVRAHGLVVTREHDGIGVVDTLGAVPRLSRTPVRPGRPAPRPGADTQEILAEHGLAAAP